MVHLALNEVDDEHAAVHWGDHVTDDEYHATPDASQGYVRDDVLVYTGPVLDQPVEVTGPVELRFQPAVNRMLHDQDHPSRLILPIIER